MDAMYYLNQLGMVCALGANHDRILQAMFGSVRSGVTLTEAYSAGRAMALGCVIDALPNVAHLPVTMRSRNNQLALAALAQIREDVEGAIARYGAHRIGIVIGTSTSGIAESETALRMMAETGSLPDDFHYAQQELVSPALMLSHVLGVSGPAYVHSSACVSSAKAMAGAARLLRMGVCDAVVTGGVDSLCGFTVAGFASLGAVSAARCNPLSAHRDGINIGEGAALFVMSREPGGVLLQGWGESSDGHHMSAPDPTGTGARLALESALARAGITADDVDYVNLHGTATVQNDAMEAAVVHDVFGDRMPVSSTKPLTGHTLGASSAIEAGLCWLAMQENNADGMLPPHLWDGVWDPALPPLNVAEPGSRLGRPLQCVVSHSFAFGGANAILVLGRA